MPYTPQSPQADLAAFNRFAKILYFALFATVGLYWMVLEMLAPKIASAEVGFLKTIFLALAAGTGAGVLLLRFGRIPPVLADTTGDAANRIQRLRLYYILCYTLSESVALYGFALRMLGARREDAALFFGAAVVLFLLCYPRLPEMLSGLGS